MPFGHLGSPTGPDGVRVPAGPHPDAPGLQPRTALKVQLPKGAVHASMSWGLGTDLEPGRVAAGGVWGRSAAPRQFSRLHILLWGHCACQPSNMLSGQWPILCVPLARPWHLVIQSNKDLGVAIEECVGACRLPVVPGHFK